MIDREILAFAARVAFCCKTTKEAFSEEEMLFIEAAYHYNEPATDTATEIEMARRAMSGQALVTED